MTKEAIILAGGLGTRLRTVLKDVPKPMATINGEAFLSYVLSFLASNGIEKVILAVGYKREVIEKYLQDPAMRYGLEICYSIEQELLGTGGAIFKAFEKVEGNDAFVVNGDTYFDCDLRELWRFAVESSADLAFALKQVEQSNRYGTVGLTQSGQITSFSEARTDLDSRHLINGGIYYLKKALVGSLTMPKKFSIEQDLFTKVPKQITAFGKVFDGLFIDIGIPEDYELAQTLLRKPI